MTNKDLEQLPTRKKGEFSMPHVVAAARKRFYKKFKKKIPVREVVKIINNWIEHYVIDGVVNGEKVKLGRHATIELVGESIFNDPNKTKQYEKGIYYADKGGKKVKWNMRRKGVQYKLVYKNDLAGEKKVYFKASSKFRKRVYKGLTETNTIYSIVNFDR